MVAPAGCRLRRATMAVALLCLSLASATALPAQRRHTDFAVSEQQPLWTRLDADGTTIGSPNWVLVRGGRVFLTDFDGPAVVALDARTGATLWRYSKAGEGPGEFRHPAIVFWHPRGAAVIDNHTRRIYLFSADGRLLAEQGVPRGLNIGNACSLADGSMVLSATVMAGPSLFRVAFGRERAETVRLPFDTAGMHPYHAAMELAPTTDGTACLGARKLTAGMALLPTAGPAVPHAFVESPAQRPFKAPSEIRDTADLPIPFALRAGVTGSTVFVWFGGIQCRNRCIDFYSLPDLRYLHTIRIEGRTGLGMHNLDIDGDLVVMLGSRDDVPMVAAYRLPRPRVR